MIRVLIVDDQALIREGLSLMLGLYDEIEIVGQANNGQEAVDFIENIEVDLVLMDIRMPVMDGVEATKIIKEKYPQVKIIILTTFNEDEYIFNGLKSGADGYILKDISSRKLVDTIKSVYKGDLLLHGHVAKTLASAVIDKRDTEKENILNRLTARELEIANLVAKGKSNREISEILYITEGTVKNHVTKILDKLELRDRTQLALLIKELKNKI
ncbi:MAG: response regulator transcription factor [Tissierellia bacterium]|nr:response regulator transcription factor [Tissierellia bacterium]